MKNKMLITLMILSFGLTGQAHDRNAERLMGYVYDEQGLTFQVYSGGCTSKSDFLIRKEFSDLGQGFTLLRLHPDTCLALLPYGIKIQFSYQELGMGPDETFQILNGIRMSHRGSSGQGL